MAMTLFSVTALAIGSLFVSSIVNGLTTTTTQNSCASEGGFGNAPESYIAREEGVFSGISLTAACISGTTVLSAMTLTIAPFAGATNISIVDAMRFYWNGTSTASVKFVFSSSGTSFFASSGPYGYLLVNSTTAGAYPVHSSDDCVGASGVSAPGTGNCKLQLLPLSTGTAGAAAAAGTSGNTVTGLVNLSAPSTVVCPPAGTAWNMGASSCTAGTGGSLTAVLAPGPSFVVLSFGFSDPPNSYPGGAASFSVTVSATAVW